MQLINAIWSYRAFIAGSVKREFQSQYNGSLLGALWLVLNPLAMVLIYTLVFSQVMKARLPGMDDTLSYSIYLIAGITTWTFFSEVVLRSTTTFIEQANLLKKAVFPRISLPIIILISSSINFVIIFSIFMGFLVVIDRVPGLVLLAFIPLLLLQQLIAIGLGLLLGTLNVFFRDIGQFTTIMLQFWFWLTPIVYPASVIPDWARDILFTWNPIAPIVQGYQTIVLQQQWPDWSSYYPQLILGIGLFILSYTLFRKLSADMVDEL
ncbi:MAG: ABC transporter permease [Pseudomonadales bacterium]|nr:ABC transporter permease [Pseudomonadales bacterium]